MAGFAFHFGAVMIDPSDELLKIFFHEHGITPPIRIARILGGRNSEVHRVSNPNGQWILKKYFHQSNDKRDRLGTEFDFLRFLEGSCNNMVARALGMDRALHIALYSPLSGTRPMEITTAHISQAVNFIKAINLSRNESAALALPKAADACLNLRAHMNLAASRIERLLAIRPNHDLEMYAYQFIKEKLLPLWLRLKANLTLRLSPSKIELPLPIESQIISPSDFGFHNALEHQGKLFFLDFEYAGWDDPAKLVCDFICQPDLPITQIQVKQFINELLPELPGSKLVEHRVEMLLPVHRLKWCCILLNEFRIEDRNRRIHAGLGTDGLLSNQLRKAKWYFDTYLEKSY